MKLEIDWAGAPMSQVSQRLFGHNTVWSNWGLGIWDEKEKTRPNPDVIDWVSEVKPGVLRFPGGTRTLTYDFQKSIGPDRAAQYDPFTGETDGTFYGYGEFFHLLEDLHARTGVRPLSTVTTPWTIGTPEHSAALVAYLNGTVESDFVIGVDEDGVDWKDVKHWAQLRADHGHPAPYNVEYLEIGNEQYLQLSGGTAKFNQAEQWRPPPSPLGPPPKEHRVPTTVRRYAEQVKRTAALIRNFDPNIKIGAQVHSDLFDDNEDINSWISKNDKEENTGDPWNPTLVEVAGEAIDFLVLHTYEVNLATHLDLTNSFKFKRLLQMSDEVKRIVAQLQSLNPSLPVGITEYGFYRLGDRFRNALVTADMIRLGAEENLEMLLRHILIENSDNAFSRSGMIRHAKTGWFGRKEWQRTPAWYALEMITKGLLPEAVRAEGQNEDFKALATRNQADANQLSVMVIGRALEGRGNQSIEFNLPPGTWKSAMRRMSGKLNSHSHQLKQENASKGNLSGKVVELIPRQSINLYQFDKET